MAKVRVKQIDAFTTTPHTGNPAGVVVDGAHLSERQMQSIAREMNISETAFVLPTSKAGADLRIRWFTPTTEVPLCGHATIATFHALAEENKLGMTRDGLYHFELETASGVLPVDVSKEGNGISVMFGLKIPAFERVTHYKLDLVRILNISLTEFENKMSILRSDYLYVPVRRLHTLFSMKPNFLSMTKFLTTHKLGGMCVFTTETIDRDSSVHSRFFAPHLGINEDPVTGSAHGPLAVLLYENKLLRIQDNKCIFQGEQGDAIGRRGRVTVELKEENNAPASVKIGGTAITILEGEMIVQD